MCAEWTLVGGGLQIAPKTAEDDILVGDNDLGPLQKLAAIAGADAHGYSLSVVLSTKKLESLADLDALRWSQ